MSLTGTHINYYFHCHRHLWLFANSIQMEHNSDVVTIGKIISENSYQREEHELSISSDDGTIVLDFYDSKNKIIHEVKKSDKMEITHIWQVKYYIYILEQKGIEGVSGEIDYPKLKQKITVNLQEEDRQELKKIGNEIDTILKLPIPPETINKPFCKQCAYYDLCYI
ncbi:MAG: CRISPR-associated protein Cas4 [Ignavibacteria bacterium]|nr:CRISPR-associated protein Cas4 [Ignavibacteria bacterium]